MNAHYHQHLFSLRVDPMVDGLHNTVMETDVLSLPTSPTSNHSGNAFYTRSAPVAGGRDFDYETDRRWAIVNPKVVHPHSRRNAGYSIMSKGAGAPLMARPDSIVARRAPWAAKPLWVVRDVEDGKGGRMWPSGKYVPQTRAPPADSMAAWAAETQSVAEEDLLVYLTMGAFLACGVCACCADRGSFVQALRTFRALRTGPSCPRRCFVSSSGPRTSSRRARRWTSPARTIRRASWPSPMGTRAAQIERGDMSIVFIW